MDKVITFAKSSSKVNVDDLLFDDTKSSQSVIDIEAFREMLGPLYEPIKELKEKYLKRIETLEEKLDSLQDTILKLPPIPQNSKTTPKTTKDLLPYFLSTDSYQKSYIICELDTDNLKRIRIHAFLSIIKDYGLKDVPLEASVDDYNASARQNIETKIKMMSQEARLQNKTLIRFINENH